MKRAGWYENALIEHRRETGKERIERDAEIATCECGARVRFHPVLGWVHSGECGADVDIVESTDADR